jgi:hypothetical protein
MEHIVYVLINEKRYITKVDSSAFLSDVTDWVEIDRGYGDKFAHARNNYFDKPIKTLGGAYQYRLNQNGKPVECSEDEIKEQERIANGYPVAPRNVIAGEYITVNSVMYKAIENIPNGEHIIVGQNAVATTIEEQLYELKGE